MLKIKWQDKIRDKGVLKEAGMQSMHTVLKLRWTGHVIRMPDERLKVARRNATKTPSKKVQVGKDQEKAQSAKDSHSKNRGGKKPN